MQYASYLERSNLSVILLTIAGNRLIVSTTIFTNAVYANELLQITLQLGPHDSENVLYVARMSMAIKKNRRDDSANYTKISTFPR